jgi:tRNA pseudouridine55 synthase
MNGLLLIDKSVGMSSAAVVGILKRRLRVERIGHAGTLDPFASGLLVVLVGRTTRLASHAVAGKKCYLAEISFGYETDTDDSTGKVTEGEGVSPLLSEAQEAAKKFVGSIQQEPPQFSAKKIGGRRAYSLARQGERVTLAPVTVVIDSLDLWFEPQSDGSSRAFFRIVCSKGTYIRSVARDIGRALGCGAHLVSLRREGSIPFSIEQTVSLELCSAGSLVPWDGLFPGAFRCSEGEEICGDLANGRERAIARVVARLDEEAPAEAKYAIVYSPGGAPHTFFVKGDAGWQFCVCAPS